MHNAYMTSQYISQFLWSEVKIVQANLAILDIELDIVHDP